MDIQEKLDKLFDECLEELLSIGINMNDKEYGTISIRLAKRNNKRYGCCKQEKPDKNYKVTKVIRRRRYVQYERFEVHTIEISKWVMELDDKIIKNTIMHELIHCMPRCNNHGEYFKNYATVINEKLGYNISRTGNKEQDFKESNLEYIEKPINFNYKIVCEDCNYSFFRQRVRRYFIRKYRCGKCGGRFKVFKIRNIIFANH